MSPFLKKTFFLPSGKISRRTPLVKRTSLWPSEKTRCIFPSGLMVSCNTVATSSFLVGFYFA